MKPPPRTIAESDRSIEAAVALWTRKADDLVVKKLADAAAHASNAATHCAPFKVFVCPNCTEPETASVAIK